MQSDFTIQRATAADAPALLQYLKIVGGETDNLSFGPEGVPLSPEEEANYLAMQEASTDHVQYLAKSGDEIIGTASLNRKTGRMRHRGVFGISLKRAYWGCGAAQGLMEAVLDFAWENWLPAIKSGGSQRQSPGHSTVRVLRLSEALHLPGILPNRRNTHRLRPDEPGFVKHMDFSPKIRYNNSQPRGEEPIPVFQTSAR